MKWLRGREWDRQDTLAVVAAMLFAAGGFLATVPLIMALVGAK